MRHFYLLGSCLTPLVWGHGAMVWPPIWQFGPGYSVENMTKGSQFSNPLVEDPALTVSGDPKRFIKYARNWLTDQSYLGGHGEQYEGGEGKITNKQSGWKAKEGKLPWASPGRAPNLGGGCGIYGGNPYGCPAGNDTRPAGSDCGQYKPRRGTFAFGSSALDIEFPNAITTEWTLGSVQDVATVKNGGHMGGYTFRLCKLPPEGKQGLTEECFAQNILEFATPYTLIRDIKKPGTWFKVDQNDLTEGTFPEGSAWRNVQYVNMNFLPLRLDRVWVPKDLPEGDYVLSYRWDTAAAAAGQVWVSCSNIRLVQQSN